MNLEDTDLAKQIRHEILVLASRLKDVSTESFKTNVTIDVRDAKTKKLLNRERTHNIITLTGRNITRDILGRFGPFTPTHMAVGTGTTAATGSDTQLETEVFRALITRRISASGQITFQLFIDETEANGNDLTEGAIINVNNSKGISTLFARDLFTKIVKTASITVTLTWEVVITAS